MTCIDDDEAWAEYFERCSQDDLHIPQEELDFVLEDPTKSEKEGREAIEQSEGSER